MPNVDYQRHSFLGGEVSPSLYERADMDKFGRWFSEAENIRFRETGAFRNRSGFVKVADTKYNQEGQIIKLLAFQFNDEEAFLVELGPNYARFYRNGQPIMQGNVPYELETPFDSFTIDDLKYAQAGDTVFIVHPTAGIIELARLQADGSNWEIRKFNTDILPMKESNDDKTKTMTLEEFSQDVKTLSLYNPDTSTYLNVEFTFNNEVVYTAASATLSEIFNGIAAAVGENYSTTLSGTTLTIAPVSSLGTLPDFSITFDTTFTTQTVHTATQTVKLLYANSASELSSGPMSFAAWEKLDSVYVKVIVNPYNNNTSSPSSATVFEGTKNLTASTLAESAQLAIGYGAFSVAWTIKGGIANISSTYGNWSSAGLSVDTSTNSARYSLYKDKSNSDASSSYYFQANITLTGHTDVINNNSYSYSSVATSTSTNYYLMTSSSGEFKNMEEGECVLVKNYVDTQTLNGSYGVGTYTLGPVISDGKWRAYSIGNWAGKIQIQYSTDNKQTWVDYYEWTSEDAQYNPYNLTTAGVVNSTDTLYFRAVINVTAVYSNSNLKFFFAADSFSVNSYYKILFKSSNTQAVVECVKNNVGLFNGQYQWRLPAFSNHEGWPQTVAFYQNRLFFGKDYILYGSRNNDFWDFYEPVALQSDDPITISLLSTKVNMIRNLVTQRSFFTFTGGGEFGIGSEGALTQADKYMKQFSANGSAPCNPVLISDVVLFVDKSFNSVRALKYSLESDGYEAPDITLTMRSLMEGERVISTDIIYEEKEALFLSQTGTIWVLKYITDQNVLSWSHWKHSFAKITNICVIPNGPKHDLYIAVESEGKKWIELLDRNEYMDTVEYFAATDASKVSVTGNHGDVKELIQNGKHYKVVIDDNGQIDAPEDTSHDFKVGSLYTSTATLLAPTVQASDYSHTNYEVRTPYKVFFYFLDSHGFKVGVDDDEQMEIDWQPVDAGLEESDDLTSGKKSVLIPSRFEGSSRVSFVQEGAYPMEVCDVLIQTDYGGK